MENVSLQYVYKTFFSLKPIHANARTPQDNGNVEGKRARGVDNPG